MIYDPAFTSPGRFFKGNIHTHSTRSDGVRVPEDVCETYREAGYDFLALTDHFLEKYDFPIVDTRPFRTGSFTTIIGAEVHAPATSAGETWHILAVGLPLDFQRTAGGETGPDLASRCIEAGAFVAIAHPAWYALTPADAATIPDAHSVEIYNHTSQIRTDRGDGTYLVDQLLAVGRRISLCATDDAHFRCQDYFGGFVNVKAQTNEPHDLTASLKDKAFYSSQGPIIEHVSYEEEFVEVICSPASVIMVLGRGSKASQHVGPGTTQVKLPLKAIRAGGYARVVVVDAQGRRAWTNPVWL